MNITVIDAQGGGMGKQIVTAIKKTFPDQYITAIGTNGIATAAMLKAGADRAATGENPVIVACRKADVIIGPVGIVIADSLMGEITPNMSIAIARSEAKKLFIPFNQCDNIIVGVNDLSMKALIASMIDELGRLIEDRDTCSKA